MNSISLWYLVIVWKILILTSGGAILNCKGALYQYMSYLDKNISRRSKQEHDKTGIHRQSNPLKESSSYIHYYKSKKLPLCHADTQMLELEGYCICRQ